MMYLMHKIQYLPLALDDLKSIVRYITDKLNAPRAAERLVAKIDKEVNKIADNPFRCHLYASPVKLKHEYRVLHINNYSLFYVASNDKVEIHRVIYSRRDIARILTEDAKGK